MEVDELVPGALQEVDIKPECLVPKVFGGLGLDLLEVDGSDLGLLPERLRFGIRRRQVLGLRHADEPLMLEDQGRRRKLDGYLHEDGDERRTVDTEGRVRAVAMSCDLLRRPLEE
ncbi:MULTISPECIES: hypothetical protein [unclassified Sphingomonas]|uniref:hypothetical protein n=1 Tax=unclassified Sphingomonas TaxID=196159 RepID=UPI00226A7A5E|nr:MULTISPECIES: hypothetical protein [unclassified Sphingomonas]